MRGTLAFLTFVVAALTAPAAAVAGGWAIVVLDELPAGLANGDGGPHRVGFTVLQHGVHPASDLQTSIAIRSLASGEVLAFSGQAEGEPGHYVAEVRFPHAAEWTWEARPGPYPPQPLGTVIVPPKGLAAGDLAGKNAEPTNELARATGWGPSALGSLRIPLASAALAAWLLFAWLLRPVLRPRVALQVHRPRPSSQPS